MKMRNVFVLLYTPLFGVGVAFAQAEVFHVKVEVPTEACLSDYSGQWATDAMACAGEDICWEGSFKGRFTLVYDPVGRLHYQETFNDSSLVGIGVESGEAYRRVGADAYSYSGDGEPPIVEHYSSVLPLIGEGSNGTLLFRYLWKITINTGGEVTVEKEDLRVECK